MSSTLKLHWENCPSLWILWLVHHFHELNIFLFIPSPLFDVWVDEAVPAFSTFFRPSKYFLRGIIIFIKQLCNLRPIILVRWYILFEDKIFKNYVFRTAPFLRLLIFDQTEPLKLCWFRLCTRDHGTYFFPILLCLIYFKLLQTEYSWYHRHCSNLKQSRPGSWYLQGPICI